jgi:hypothetical protein
MLRLLGLCSTLGKAFRRLRQHRSDTLAFAALLFRWSRGVLPAAHFVAVSAFCFALGGVLFGRIFVECCKKKCKVLIKSGGFAAFTS